VSSAIAMRHLGSTGPFPVLTADTGPAADAPAPPEAVGTAGTTIDDDHGEVAWRLRHTRRGILKDVMVPEEVLAGDTPPDTNVFGDPGFFSRVAASPAKFATNLFSTTPFSGQLNLLTTGSFETPEQLFTTSNFARSVAYLAVGAPIGEHADWTARAALTQGISSWIVAGEYTTRAPEQHRYDLGLSYSTQRYDGGNFAALRGVTDGSRNAGAIYGFDTYSVTPKVTLTYGGRYAHYDYLDERNLYSPRVAVTLPGDHFRISDDLAPRVAPSAEGRPRMDTGIWLPPRQAFSSLLNGRPMSAEHTDHVEVEWARVRSATGASARSSARGDQLALNGINARGACGTTRTLRARGGDVDTSGLSAGSRAFAQRVHGAVSYSLIHANWTASDDASFLVLFAPSAVRSRPEHIHDVSASIETEVPETSTRVLVLYRLSNGFAHAGAPGQGLVTGSALDHPMLDSRFDVRCVVAPVMVSRREMEISWRFETSSVTRRPTNPTSRRLLVGRPGASSAAHPEVLSGDDAGR
jgi:hypothetical protein